MLPIFIVSLKQDSEKRTAIATLLQQLGLDFEFIEAVYGKQLSTAYLNSILVKSTGFIFARGFLPTPGEVGCTLSHLKVYQQLLARDLQWACVLEDDVIIDDRFKQFITNFSSENLDPRSLYLLGGQNGLYTEKFIVKSRKNVKTIGEQKFYKTIKSESTIRRTCCYLISAELAKSFLNLAESKFILADDWEYLVTNHYINSIYLANFVDHPVDLANSHIESERSDSIATFTPGKVKKMAFNERLKGFVQRKQRLLLLNSYRWVERKD